MRARWIAAAAVAGALAALVLCATRSASYEATVSLVVAPAQPRPTALTETAAALVRSRSVTENVVQALGLHESPAHLESEIGVHVRPGTSIVDITVRRSSATDAERVAQQVLVVF